MLCSVQLSMKKVLKPLGQNEKIKPRGQDEKPEEQSVSPNKQTF